MVDVQTIDGENVETWEAEVPRLKPIPWSDINTLPRRHSLLSGILDKGALSVLYGASNTGKSFLALDIGTHVALGWAWRGQKVRPGAVVYIAAEGGLGVQERLTAFRIHHGVEVEGVPLWIIPEPIDLCRSDDDTKLLVERIENLQEERSVELIVVDTLSRALAGGNENSSEDMGQLVRHLDMLKMKTGAHVMVIHHAGKDDSRGARGHSLLKAAADTEIEVTKDPYSGVATATIVKQRDHETGNAYGFRLEPVEIGKNKDNETIASCAVIEAEPTSPTKRKAGRINHAAQIALRALALTIRESGETPPPSRGLPTTNPVATIEMWKNRAYTLGICKSTNLDSKYKAFTRARDSLVSEGKIGLHAEWAWPK